MAVSDKLKSLVDQMPNPDGRGMYTLDGDKPLDKEKIEKAVAEIAKGGTENVAGLVEMLGEPGTAENVKPHYALHCVMNYPLITGDDGMRKAFCETLGKKLDSDITDFNKGYLCQELQWAGRKESVGPLAKQLNNEALTEPASMALVAIGGPEAIDAFRKALKKSKGKCLLNIMDGLAALADAGSAKDFLNGLKDDDREVRLASCAGLAKIGGDSAVDPLLKAADCDPGWERIRTTKYCIVLAERMQADGKKDAAKKIYSHLRDTRTSDEEAYLKELATNALKKI